MMQRGEPTREIGALRIGTSGWSYDHWSGPFYPAGLAPGERLRHYATRFDTVEINNTFYHLPEPATLRAWRDTVPDGFVFACKASRYITHMTKLKGAGVETFFERLELLGRRLGPVLFQLPPRWHANPERLDRFLDGLPGGRRYAFELRDATWFADSVYACLERHGAALCLWHLAGRLSPVRLTADWTYVRLHGPGEAYRGRYDGRTLAGWARRIAGWLEAGLDVYCYFDNDEMGYAAGDALRLREMVTSRLGPGARRRS